MGQSGGPHAAIAGHVLQLEGDIALVARQRWQRRLQRIWAAHPSH